MKLRIRGDSIRLRLTVAETVSLPRQAGIDWAGSNTVSLFAEQDLGEAGALSLLVEKDFKCLAPGGHRHEADDEDTFPHPNA